MSVPVWSLSVDLQARTATFQSGMADAAKAARGSFSEIKEGAQSMGSSTSGSMAEARHGVMLLGEEFGVHLPRGITMFLSSLGPVAAAMEAAFPFLAIIVGATLLLEHLAKLKEANVKIGAEWGSVEVEATKALNKMGDALLQVEMESDRLSGNSLAALQKQLQLIDHQTMSELESTFDALASKIDATLKAAGRGSLMTTLIGEGASDKVKAEFDKFKEQYDALLSRHDDSGARGALVGEIIQAQAQLQKYQAMPQANSWVREAVGSYALLNEQLENMNRAQGIADTMDDERKKNAKTEAQNAHPEDFNPELFVDAENKKRVSLAETLAAIKKEQEASNAAAKSELEGMEALDKGLKEIATDRAKLAEEAGKEGDRHDTKMAELQAASDREAAQMKLAQGRMSEQQYLDLEMSFAAQEYNAKKQALDKELAALEGNGAEVENKKREINNKLLELDRQFQNQDQQREDQADKKRLTSLQESQRRITAEFNQGFTQVLMGKESWGKMMQSLDSQIASMALQNMLQSLEQKKAVGLMHRFEDARTSAADAFRDAGNPFLGAVMAAATFAEVMALAEGGIVPGVGMGDTVPAMLTPGEAVLPKQMTENLTNAAKFGGANGDTHVHLHHSPTYHVQTIDSDGIRKTLTKHKEEFAQHFRGELRKLNR